MKPVIHAGELPVEVGRSSQRALMMTQYPPGVQPRPAPEGKQTGAVFQGSEELSEAVCDVVGGHEGSLVGTPRTPGETGRDRRLNEPTETPSLGGPHHWSNTTAYCGNILRSNPAIFLSRVSCLQNRGRAAVRSGARPRRAVSLEAKRWVSRSRRGASLRGAACPVHKFTAST
ncbi:unnamed protein product [Boreogadus saida]